MAEPVSRQGQRKMILRRMKENDYQAWQQSLLVTVENPCIRQRVKKAKVPISNREEFRNWDEIESDDEEEENGLQLAHHKVSVLNTGCHTVDERCGEIHHEMLNDRNSEVNVRYDEHFVSEDLTQCSSKYSPEEIRLIKEVEKQVQAERMCQKDESPSYENCQTFINCNRNNSYTAGAVQTFVSNIRNQSSSRDTEMQQEFHEPNRKIPNMSYRPENGNRCKILTENTRPDYQHSSMIDTNMIQDFVPRDFVSISNENQFKQNVLIQKQTDHNFQFLSNNEKRNRTMFVNPNFINSGWKSGCYSVEKENGLNSNIARGESSVREIISDMYHRKRQHVDKSTEHVHGQTQSKKQKYKDLDYPQQTQNLNKNNEEYSVPNQTLFMKTKNMMDIISQSQYIHGQSIQEQWGQRALCQNLNEGNTCYSHTMTSQQENISWNVNRKERQFSKFSPPTQNFQLDSNARCDQSEGFQLNFTEQIMDHTQSNFRFVNKVQQMPNYGKKMETGVNNKMVDGTVSSIHVSQDGVSCQAVVDISGKFTNSGKRSLSKFLISDDHEGHSNLLHTNTQNVQPKGNTPQINRTRKIEVLTEPCVQSPKKDFTQAQKGMNSVKKRKVEPTDYVVPDINQIETFGQSFSANKSDKSYSQKKNVSFTIKKSGQSSTQKKSQSFTRKKPEEKGHFTARAPKTKNKPLAVEQMKRDIFVNTFKAIQSSAKATNISLNSKEHILKTVNSCPVIDCQGCGEFSLKDHAFREHLPLIFKEESKSDTDNLIHFKKVKILREVASWILRTKPTLDGLVRFFNQGKKLPDLDVSESVDDMTSFCKCNGWAIPLKFKTNPINSVSVLINWHVLLYCVKYMTCNQRNRFRHYEKLQKDKYEVKIPDIVPSKIAILSNIQPSSRHVGKLKTYGHQDEAGDNMIKSIANKDSVGVTSIAEYKLDHTKVKPDAKVKKLKEDNQKMGMEHVLKNEIVKRDLDQGQEKQCDNIHTFRKDRLKIKEEFLQKIVKDKEHMQEKQASKTKESKEESQKMNSENLQKTEGERNTVSDCFRRIQGSVGPVDERTEFKHVMDKHASTEEVVTYNTEIDTSPLNELNAIGMIDNQSQGASKILQRHNVDKTEGKVLHSNDDLNEVASEQIKEMKKAVQMTSVSLSNDENFLSNLYREKVHISSGEKLETESTKDAMGMFEGDRSVVPNEVKISRSHVENDETSCNEKQYTSISHSGSTAVPFGTPDQYYYTTQKSTGDRVDVDNSALLEAQIKTKAQIKTTATSVVRNTNNAVYNSSMKTDQSCSSTECNESTPISIQTEPPPAKTDGIEKNKLEHGNLDDSQKEQILEHGARLLGMERSDMLEKEENIEDGDLNTSKPDETGDTVKEHASCLSVTKSISLHGDSAVEKEESPLIFYVCTCGKIDTKHDVVFDHFIEHGGKGSIDIVDIRIDKPDQASCLVQEESPEETELSPVDGFEIKSKTSKSGQISFKQLEHKEKRNTGIEPIKADVILDVNESSIDKPLVDVERRIQKLNKNMPSTARGLKQGEEQKATLAKKQTMTVSNILKPRIISLRKPNEYITTATSKTAKHIGEHKTNINLTKRAKIISDCQTKQVVVGNRSFESKEKTKHKTNLSKYSAKDTFCPPKQPTWVNGKPCPVKGCIGEKTSFSSYTAFDNHWRSFHIPKIIYKQCIACGIMMQRKYNMKQHVQKAHKGKTELIIKIETHNSCYVDPGAAARYYR